ncbi:MAG: single-stranded-DNA-specific exonuclease RecJ [Chitinivibrionales bacterium]|nr:single-stranded-DNA-specific exonuclease RecJ [Chitinivibrionales bacterium]
MNIVTEPISPRILIRPVEESAIKRLMQDLPISELLARIFVGRGIFTGEDCKKFFTTDIAQLHDPFLFNGMKRAIERISRAIVHKEKIVVYGDYDVDGVTATALCLRVLRACGAQADFYLPNRLVEGYGLQEAAVLQIAEGGAKLLITVDCGISGVAAVAAANRAGLDVIITDHHEPHGELPPAVAVLNPKIEGCGYPDASLAGVGVALKLCQALVSFCHKNASLWQDDLDIVALGTVADVVPLTGENRCLVTLGFTQLAQSNKPGLRALMEVQGFSGKKLSTGNVAFGLAPCINAGGRLGDAHAGVELLLTQDPITARTLALAMKQANMERRSIDEQVQEEAFAWINEHVKADRDCAVVAASPNWHSGVIGIVASRIVERLHRPTLLFAVNEAGIAKGSGRSIAGLNLLLALKGCADLLTTWGGHAAAAGLSLPADKIDELRTRFNATVKEMVSPEDFLPTIVADAAVDFPALTVKFLNTLTRMEPFGQGNPRPVFLCRDIDHRYAPRIVGNKHLKMALKPAGGAGGVFLDAIAFGSGERLSAIAAAKNFSVAFSLENNDWNNTLQMNIKGVAL